MRFTQTQLENMIENLSFEQFRQFVKLYLRDTIANSEVELIDGTNDGGNDCRVLVDGSLVRRNYQITIQDSKFKQKLDEDVRKAEENVKRFAYTPSLDFFYSHTISGEKKNEYEKDAADKHNIILRFYDKKYLASEIDRSPQAYAFLIEQGTGGAIDLIRAQPMDEMERTVYDLLTGGGEIHDLKSEFIYSFMLCYLFDNEQKSPEELAQYLNNTIHCDISGYFITTYFSGRVADIQIDKSGLYSLTPEAKNVIQFHRINNSKECDALLRAIDTLLTKYRIQDVSALDILDSLKDIYAKNADIEIRVPGKDNILALSARAKSINKLRSMIQKKNIDLVIVDSIVNEIIDLSGKNDYLSKLTNTYLFSNLLRSSDLDKYVNTDIRRVWIDTQVLLPMICVLAFDLDLPDFQFKAAASLFEKAERVDGRVQFFTTDMYVEEVAVHFWEAIAVSSLENSINISELGGSRNYFYNFYTKGIKEGFINNEFFSDFVDELLDTTEIGSLNRKDFIKEASRSISECLSLSKISVFDTTKYNTGTYDSYVNHLMDLLRKKRRSKSYTSVRSDIKSVLLLSEKGLNYSQASGTYSEPYLVTWDASLRIYNENYTPDPEHGHWHVYSPLQLANRLSVMNFKVDPQLLSSEIISLTEKNFSSANEKRRFVDTLALFVDQNYDRPWKLAQKLSRLKGSTINNLPDKEIEGLGPKNALDSVLTKIYEEYSIPNRTPDFTELIAAMHDENKTDSFYDIIINACENFNVEDKLSKDAINEIDALISQEKKQ